LKNNLVPKSASGERLTYRFTREERGKLIRRYWVSLWHFSEVKRWRIANAMMSAFLQLLTNKDFVFDYTTLPTTLTGAVD